jgi:hypothetical protein
MFGDGDEITEFLEIHFVSWLRSGWGLRPYASGAQALTN